MNTDSALDIPYRLNSRIVSTIKSIDSIAIFGAGAPIELSVALFQVLMAFAESRTTRRAFHMLDMDVDLDEFSKIIDDFVARGLLQRERSVDDDGSLQELLKPGAFRDAARADKIGGWMRQGRAIVIPDALPADFAEEVHRDLYRSTDWIVTEGGHDFFHHRNSVINELEERGLALAACSRLFRSTATRSFIAALSGRDCAGEAQVAAAWYRAGEYALPHDDSTANDSRSVAYIWYLTKEWRQEWGGALFWCPTGQYICPTFNMLVMFIVAPSNIHFICPVAPGATGKRLTINGFWSRPERPSPSAPISPEAAISPPAYGQRAPDDSELSPVVIL